MRCGAEQLECVAAKARLPQAAQALLHAVSGLQQENAKLVCRERVAVHVILSVSVHRTGGRRAVEAGIQIIDEVVPVGVQAQAVLRLDREQHATGFTGNDRRIRIELSQVDEYRTLLDVMTLVDVTILVIQNKAITA